MIVGTLHNGAPGRDASDAADRKIVTHPLVGTIERDPTSGFAADDLVAQCHGSNVGPMGELRRGNGSLTGGVPFLAHPLSAEGADAGEDGTGRGEPIIPIQYAEQWGRDKRQNGVGLGQEGDPSFTLDASYPHGIGGEMGVRRLTPLECERLQAFPDGWTCLCLDREAYVYDPDRASSVCKCPDSPRYRALGNAVTVTVIEWIGKRMNLEHKKGARP